MNFCKKLSFIFMFLKYKKVRENFADDIKKLLFRLKNKFGNSKNGGQGGIRTPEG